MVLYVCLCVCIDDICIRKILLTHNQVTCFLEVRRRYQNLTKLVRNVN